MGEGDELQAEKGKRVERDVQKGRSCLLGGLAICARGCCTRGEKLFDDGQKHFGFQGRKMG